MCMQAYLRTIFMQIGVGLAWLCMIDLRTTFMSAQNTHPKSCSRCLSRTSGVNPRHITFVSKRPHIVLFFMRPHHSTQDLISYLCSAILEHQDAHAPTWARLEYVLRLICQVCIGHVTTAKSARVNGENGTDAHAKSFLPQSIVFCCVRV
jgi:hypothetical protein